MIKKSELKDIMYVGHSSYKAEYPSNSMLMYRYLVEDQHHKIVECDIQFTKDNVPVLSHWDNTYRLATINGVRKDFYISQNTLEECFVLDYSKGQDFKVDITTFESLVKYAHERDVLLQIDMAKDVHSKLQLTSIYGIVNKYKMQHSCIWEVGRKDFLYLSTLNRNMIYQLDGAWNIKGIIKAFIFSFHSHIIIVNHWFDDGKITLMGGARIILKLAHVLGLVTKCAPINNQNDVDYLTSTGVDMFLTDSLKR